MTFIASQIFEMSQQKCAVQRSTSKAGSDRWSLKGTEADSLTNRSCCRLRSPQDRLTVQPFTADINFSRCSSHDALSGTTAKRGHLSKLLAIGAFPKLPAIRRASDDPQCFAHRW